MKNLRMINSNKQHEACNSIDSASNFEGDITIYKQGLQSSSINFKIIQTCKIEIKLMHTQLLLSSTQDSLGGKLQYLKWTLKE